MPRTLRLLAPTLALALFATACNGDDPEPEPENTAPTADAGADLAATVGQAATLDGSASSDADGDTLSFAWTIASAPAGSSARLTGADGATPSLTPDVSGEYVLQLVVNDGTVDSAPDTVTVAANAAPTAVAGDDFELALGMLAGLDASASSDLEGANLTYAWAVTAVPAGSGITAASLTDATTAMPTFTPDKVGDYTLEVTVSDGAATATDAITVKVREFVVVTHGKSITLMRHTGSAFEAVDTESVPSEGMHAQTTIFSLIQLPGTSTFYATMLNGPGNDRWWGDAQLHRFEVTPAGVAYDGLAFAYDRAKFPSAELSGCSGSSDETPDGQIGNNAPVNGTFSPDGSQLYITDDCRDTFQIFDVDATTGDLELVFDGARTWLHGMAAHPTLPYVYNGAQVIEVDGQTATTLAENYDDGGNFTTIVDGEWLFTTVQATNSFAIYALTDPAAPAQVAIASIGSNGARALAVHGDRTAVVGRNTLTTFTFDGAQLTQTGQLRGTPEIPVEHRAVAFVGEGGTAFSAWFATTNPDDWTQIGGYQVFSIAADGTPTASEPVALDGVARYVTTLNLP